MMRKASVILWKNSLRKMSGMTCVGKHDANFFRVENINNSGKGFAGSGRWTRLLGKYIV